MIRSGDAQTPAGGAASAPSERTIFLDLDGTLLDISERYFRLHGEAAARFGGRPLPRETYWRLKRDRVPETDILARTGLRPRAVAAAAAARGRRVESSRYLRLDQPWPWTVASLAALARLAPLVLVTLRHNRDRLCRQLDALGLARFLSRVVAGPGDGTPAAKAALLRAERIAAPPGSVFVGDTEVDIESGRALGLSTVALRCGLRSSPLLEACKPDHLLDDLPQVVERLAALGWGRLEGAAGMPGADNDTQPDPDPKAIEPA